MALVIFQVHYKGNFAVYLAIQVYYSKKVEDEYSSQSVKLESLCTV